MHDFQDFEYGRIVNRLMYLSMRLTLLDLRCTNIQNAESYMKLRDIYIIFMYVSTLLELCTSKQA